MKRFLRVTNFGIFSKETLSKQDLLDVKSHFLEALIDTQEGKWYDAEANEWKPIQ